MKKHWLITGFLLCSLFVFAQADTTTPIRQIPDSGMLLDKGWKFNPGNSVDFSTPGFDDRSWVMVSLDTAVSELSGGPRVRSGWYRFNFTPASAFKDSIAALIVDQYAASEIYLDGRVIKQSGIKDETTGLTRPFSNNQSLPLFISPGLRHVLAIHFSYQVPAYEFIKTQIELIPISVRIRSMSSAIKPNEAETNDSRLFVGLSYINATFFILFLLLFIFYPRQRLNLYFSLFSLFVFLNLVFWLTDVSVTDITLRFWKSKAYDLNGRMIGTMILCFILVALFNKVALPFRIYNAVMLLIDFPMSVIFPSTRPVSVLVQGLFMAMTLGLAVYAFGRKKREDWLIGLIALSVFVINLTVIVNAFLHRELTIIIILVNIVIPLSMTIYLALRYAGTSRSLEKQLDEVKSLSEDNLKREKEKQEILTTQNERLEVQVTDRTAALNNSLTELKAAQAQLIQSEKMASLGELTAGIAHEIQNPLNFVNNFSEINLDLIGELKTEKLKAAAERNEQLEAELLHDIAANEEKIIHHGRRADAIVKGMLQHSRAETGTKELTDLNVLATEYLGLAYHGFRARNPDFHSEIKKDLDPAMPKMMVIPEDIGRVLLNLFNNAFYSMAKKRKLAGPDYSPALTLQTKMNQGGMELAITDNGIGIPGNLVDKIFQPFFTTKPAGEGTGLGLSLGYDIIKAHGGSIVVASGVPDITTFRIIL